MRRLSGSRHTLLVEMLEDRRVLSTLALGAVLEAPVEAAAGTIAAATAQLQAATNNITALSGLVSKPERPDQGPPTQVIERLAEQLPQHVIGKHPLLNDVANPPPTLPDSVDEQPSPPANPGNGNSGGGSGSANPGNSSNPINPGNGNVTRPDTTTTLPPTTSTPSGPAADRPDQVDVPGSPARPDDSDTAPVQDLKLTFTPEGSDIAVRNEVAAAVPAGGAQQQSGAASESVVAEVGTSTRLVQESVEAGVRPTEDAARSEDGATAELLEQIAFLEAEAAAATTPGQLQGADLAALTGGGIDLRALDEALRQAVATAQRAGQAVAQTVAQPGFATWIVGSIGSLLALEGLRRVRRRRARLAGTLADDPALTWVPGMPGSLSIEDA